MSKPKSNAKIVKRLYNELKKVENKPSTRESRKFPERTILTKRGRIENKIKLLEK
jgi:hypothetical protein